MIPWHDITWFICGLGNLLHIEIKGDGGVAGEAMSRKLDMIWEKLQAYE